MRATRQRTGEICAVHPGLEHVRPLSPHLQVYDMLQMTSAISISHRISGVVWTAGVVVMTPILPFVWTTPPDLLTWVLLAATGMFGAVGITLAVHENRLILIGEQFRKLPLDGVERRDLHRVGQDVAGAVRQLICKRLSLPNAPFKLADAEGKPLPEAVITRDLWHLFYQNQMQINGGRNDGFVAWGDSGALVMGHYGEAGKNLGLWQIATLGTLLVMIVLVLIPVLVTYLASIHAHYRHVKKELGLARINGCTSEHAWPRDRTRSAHTPAPRSAGPPAGRGPSPPSRAVRRARSPTAARPPSR